MANGFTTITIGEKPVGIKFDYRCVKLFHEAGKGKGDLYFIDIGEDKKPSLTIFGLGKLLHCAYLSNCERKEAEPEIELEPFLEFVENLNESDSDKDKDELVRILKVYTDSSYNKKVIEATNGVEKKSQEEVTI